MGKSKGSSGGKKKKSSSQTPNAVAAATTTAEVVVDPPPQGANSYTDAMLNFTKPQEVVRYFETYRKKRTSYLQSPQETQDRERMAHDAFRKQFQQSLDNAINFILISYDTFPNSEEDLILRITPALLQFLLIERGPGGEVIHYKMCNAAFLLWSELQKVWYKKLSFPLKFPLNN